MRVVIRETMYLGVFMEDHDKGSPARFNVGTL